MNLINLFTLEETLELPPASAGGLEVIFLHFLMQILGLIFIRHDHEVVKYYRKSIQKRNDS
jgi:hypothetical protein